jgi:3',5'-cyclic AMP phosphodiesterase CpdA
MTLILHLSDLHLGSPSDWQLDYTDKFGLDRAAGNTKTDHLKQTLRALGERLSSTSRRLDAIVVSGDLTNANQSDGYAEFPQLLTELGSSLPRDERIMVVPGNHDTDWSIQPGDRAKFKRFLDATRGRYASSLLNGLDYDQTNLRRSAGSRGAPCPILELDDVTLVAISSADFCGVIEQKSKTPWDRVVGDYRAGDGSDEAIAARKQAADELRRLRLFDMARIDKRQIEALADRLKRTSFARAPDEDTKLRVAVLHHPIGPVTDREEIKAFDAMTNLAEVRNFLFDQGFHLVLHGHKHESYTAWEWLLPPSESLADGHPWRALVLGAPGDFQPGSTVCRLVDVSPDGYRPVAGAPRIRVIDVPGTRASETLKLELAGPSLSLAQPFVRSTDAGTPWVVRAKSADAAYQQLVDLPATVEEPRPVITVIEDPQSVWQLPSNYPEDRDTPWLTDLVRWWQLEEPLAVRAFAGSDFNHGERLYAPTDAIARAVEALPSSKAVALLIDRGEAGHPGQEFPALTAIQLHARRDGEGTLLDVTGIYRKQDLALWWPVNMAELASIQQRALSTADTNSGLRQPVSPGRLVAIATIGVHDSVLPQMAGTVLDRAIDLQPEWPHRLAYLAAQPRAETQAEWENALSDVGEREQGVVLIPSIGLERLAAALEMHREIGSASNGFVKVVGAVERLAADAGAAAAAVRADAVQSDADYWPDKLQTGAADVLKALRSVLRAAGIAWH